MPPRKKAPLRVVDAPYIHEQLRHLAVPIADLAFDSDNARHHDEQNVRAVRSSIKRFGQYLPIVVQKQGMIIRVGNCRTRVMGELGYTHVAALVVDEGNVDAVTRALADNRTGELGQWNENFKAQMEFIVTHGIDSVDMGFDAPDVPSIIAEAVAHSFELPAAPPPPAPPTAAEPEARPDVTSLADRFGVPPFSVLDARQGYWQDRKRKWISLGIQSDAGRGDKLTYNIAMKSTTSANGESVQTSIFDPVLAELAVKWFSPVGGLVLDPFAGGSVRGVVAAVSGRRYLGIDLRQEQVDANRAQAEAMGLTGATWVCGDSGFVLPNIEEPVDMILSCPPYYDLEVYSDDPSDLSNLSTYEDFMVQYRDIIQKSVDRLAPDSFAVWVVGEMRDKAGFYRGFVPDTIRAFTDAGALLYNEVVLVTAIGTLAVRASRSFQSGRKIGKTHQNVLVFYKGDPKNIRDKFGVVDMGDDQEESDEDASTDDSPVV